METIRINKLSWGANHARWLNGEQTYISGMEMVLKPLACLPCSHLTSLLIQESFIAFIPMEASNYIFE
jgi:hypothetical protein